MLDVNIEKILPVTEVRDSLNKIIDEVEATDELYVITKNGKPAAIIVGVHHLEKLTGISHKELMPDEGKTEEAPAIPAASNDLSQPTAPATSPADDLFSGDANAATPPPVFTTTDYAAPAPATSPTPISGNTALDTPPIPVTPTTMPDLTTPAAPLDSATPTTNASGTNNTFATPDSAALSNADDLFGPPADAAPTAPLTVPANPNLASDPTAAPVDLNQSQNQTPPAAPTQT